MFNFYTDRFKNFLVIDKPGYYEPGFIDATGFDHGIVIASSDVILMNTVVFDDYAADSQVIKGTSINNEGSAYTNNGGRDNKFLNCVEYGNRGGFKNFVNSIGTVIDSSCRSQTEMPIN